MDDLTQQFYNEALEALRNLRATAQRLGEVAMSEAARAALDILEWAGSEDGASPGPSEA